MILAFLHESDCSESVVRPLLLAPYSFPKRLDIYKLIWSLAMLLKRDSSRSPTAFNLFFVSNKFLGNLLYVLTRTRKLDFLVAFLLCLRVFHRPIFLLLSIAAERKPLSQDFEQKQRCCVGPHSIHT